MGKLLILMEDRNPAALGTGNACDNVRQAENKRRAGRPRK
jgi:hypothetical protein